MSPLQMWLAGLVRQSSKTQRELAAECGISEKHLSQMLTGRCEGSLSMWSRVLVASDQLHVSLTPEGSDRLVGTKDGNDDE